MPSILATHRFWAFASVVIVALAVNLGWVGHIGSDDIAYTSMAESFAEGLLKTPVTHWETRYTVVFPVALSFKIFGPGEIASVLPHILFGIVCLLLLFRIATKLGGSLAATFACLLVGTTILFVENMTTCYPDICELMLCLGSVFLFHKSLSKVANAHWLLIASGLCFGLAVLTRETSLSLGVFYGLLFLAGFRMPRGRYLWIGVGFGVVIAGEMLFSALAFGEPLLRYKLALAHKGLDLSIPEPVGGLVTNRWLAPFGVIFAGPQLGLAGIVAIIAGLLAARRESWLRWDFTLYALLGLVWIAVVGYGLGLRPLPRYFIVPGVVVVLFAALALTQLWREHRGIVAAVVVLCVGANLLLVDLSNQQFMLPSRLLAENVLARPAEQVRTDPSTVWRAQKLIEWRGGVSGEALFGMPPPPGGLFLYVPRTGDVAPAAGYISFQTKDYKPAADWTLVSTERGRPTRIGAVMFLLGLDRRLSAAGLDRLLWETSPVMVYRVPAR